MPVGCLPFAILDLDQQSAVVPVCLQERLQCHDPLILVSCVRFRVDQKIPGKVEGLQLGVIEIVDVLAGHAEFIQEAVVPEHRNFIAGKLNVCLNAIDRIFQRLVESTDERIMTLQAFLDAYRNNCRLLIEIKNREWEASYRNEIKVRKTMAMAAPAAGDSIMVSSFDLDSLVYAHQCRPEIPLIYNFETDQTIEDAKRILSAQPFLYGFCLPIATLDEPMVKLLRSHDKCIAVYTCNSDEEINKALELGVDILISDVPQQALQMRDQG